MRLRKSQAALVAFTCVCPPMAGFSWQAPCLRTAVWAPKLLPVSSFASISPAKLMSTAVNTAQNGQQCCQHSALCIAPMTKSEGANESTLRMSAADKS
jgi:hypothetical protein